MSSKIQEKQPQKDNKRDLDADDIFNQQLFKTLAYAGAGFGAGIVASVFLKHRKALSLIGAGTGAAYGYTNFMSELNNFNKFKDFAQQGQQSNTLKREDQLATKNWDQFMPKQENLSQQKRYGGSDDDSDSKNKERKQSQESKSRDNKGGEQKGHEATQTRPKTQAKSPTESQHTSGGKQQEKPQQSNKKETERKDSDKSSSQQSKSSAPSPKESSKQEHQQKGDSQKKESQGKEQQQRVVQGERNIKGEKNLTAGSESKSPNLGAQHLQDFKTNPGPGKPAKGEDTLHRGAERNVRGKNELDDLNNQQSRMVKQDANYKSVRTGNKMKVEETPENIAGGQFSGKGLTAKSQVNAVIE